MGVREIWEYVSHGSTVSHGITLVLGVRESREWTFRNNWIKHCHASITNFMLEHILQLRILYLNT